MKEFFKTMLRGLRMVLISFTSTTFFGLAYAMFELFVNAIGFAALGFAFLVMLCITIGSVTLFFIGMVTKEPED